MTVRWSDPAVADLAGVFAYLSADNADAATRVTDRLYAAAEALGRFPNLGRPGRTTGRRELVVDQYVITYRVRRDAVEVVRIEHGTRRR